MAEMTPYAAGYVWGAIMPNPFPWFPRSSIAWELGRQDAIGDRAHGAVRLAFEPEVARVMQGGGRVMAQTASNRARGGAGMTRAKLHHIGPHKSA